MVLGVVRNPYSLNVPNNLAAIARRERVPVREIDLETLALRIPTVGGAEVFDLAGPIEVTSVAPYLLFGFPTAPYALAALSRDAYTQNPVSSVLAADDKATTAEILSAAGVAQVPTYLCALDDQQALAIAGEIGYPVVVKRTHGAQGRWVRRVDDADALRGAVREFQSEGRSSIVIQPEIIEFSGRSVRVLVTGGSVRGATQRSAGSEEWHSNIARGASQRPTTLSATEYELAEAAVRALGLRHGGVDLLRSRHGPLVLEVNSCPDFTSMLPYFTEDLSLSVLRSSMSGETS